MLPKASDASAQAPAAKRAKRSAGSAKKARTEVAPAQPSARAPTAQGGADDGGVIAQGPTVPTSLTTPAAMPPRHSNEGSDGSGECQQPPVCEKGSEVAAAARLTPVSPMTSAPRRRVREKAPDDTLHLATAPSPPHAVASNASVAAPMPSDALNTATASAAKTAVKRQRASSGAASKRERPVSAAEVVTKEETEEPREGVEHGLHPEAQAAASKATIARPKPAKRPRTKAAAPQEVAAAPSTPTLALAPKPRERGSSGPLFAATGLEPSGRQRRILVDLGVSFADDWSPDITHLLADTFRRTTKMMCAICLGARIVVPDYISACRAANKLVDEQPYLLKDDVCEAAFARKRGISGGYSLLEAVERARKNGPLLHGISVYCFPSVAEKRELPLLVAAAGGSWLTRFPAERADDESVLLLAERAVSNEKEQQRRRQHRVYDVELLREAACTQVVRRSAYRLR